MKLLIVLSFYCLLSIFKTIFLIKRIDAVPHFFEDENYLDEEIVPGKEHDTYESVTRKFTYNLQPEAYLYLNFSYLASQNVPWAKFPAGIFSEVQKQQNV